MRKVLLLLSASALATIASGCSRTPAPSTASHPPAEDLRCQAEPAAPTAEQIDQDTDGSTDERFNDGVLISGRSCRDTLRRACQWHVDRGAKDLDCTDLPAPGATSSREAADKRAVASLFGGGGQSAPRVDVAALRRF